MATEPEKAPSVEMTENPKVSERNENGETLNAKVTKKANAVPDAERLDVLLRDYAPGTPEERKLVRKVDMFLIPCLWVMYILNYVDRTNIGNAKIAGMEDDLSLSDDDYAWVLSIFFFGYLLFEVPSNMILSRVRPSLYLPGIMFVWGVLSALMALSNSYQALLGFRFVLGCIEAGFFPGVLYLLSCWYTKAELGKRIAAFYTAAVISGAFGGLLAGAISDHLHNARGIAGWRWLFIVEGVTTVAASLVATFILLDYPFTSPRLSKEEQDLAYVRIVADAIARGDRRPGAQPLSHKAAFVAAVSDPRTYVFILLFMLDVGAGTISYFIPTITKTLGYETVQAQYMTVPIYIVAAASLNALAWSSDRKVERRWHIFSSLAVGLVAAIVCAAVQQPVARYVMVCVLAAGIYSALPLILSWTSNTISVPGEKRAIVLAMVNAFGNLSSVYGSRIWPDKDKPAYHIGFGCTAGFLGAAMVLAAVLPILCKAIYREKSEPEPVAFREHEDRQP